jgi:hypothetical protein
VKKDKEDQKTSTNGISTNEEVSQAEKMLEQILSKADVVSATGKGILTFEAMPVLTPRYSLYFSSYCFCSTLILTVLFFFQGSLRYRNVPFFLEITRKNL